VDDIDAIGAVAKESFDDKHGPNVVEEAATRS
jgi:hypothetical protein